MNAPSTIARDVAARASAAREVFERAASERTAALRSACAESATFQNAIDRTATARHAAKRAAKTPAGQILLLVRQVWDEAGYDDIGRQAAATAYHLFFSFVPLLIFLTTLAAGISRRVAGTDEAVDAIMDWLFDQFPSATFDEVERTIRGIIGQQRVGLLSAGMLLTLYGARNAMNSLVLALNVAYRTPERRPWFRRQLLAITLTIGTGGALITSAAAFLLGNEIGLLLAGPLDLNDAWVRGWELARWPFIIVLMLLGIDLLYWIGPTVRLKFRLLSPGAVMALTLWGVATFGLSYYFRNFAGYANSYGVLGGMLAFVFWLYVMNYIFLLGGVLNVTLARQRAAAAAEAHVVPSEEDDPEAALFLGEYAAEELEHWDETERRLRGGAAPQPTYVPYVPWETRVSGRMRHLARRLPLLSHRVAAPIPFVGNTRGADQDRAAGTTSLALDPQDRDRRRRERSVMKTLALAALAIVVGILSGRQRD